MTDKEMLSIVLQRFGSLKKWLLDKNTSPYVSSGVVIGMILDIEQELKELGNEKQK